MTVLDEVNEKLDKILLLLLNKKTEKTDALDSVLHAVTPRLTEAETKSLRKLEQEWEDDEDAALTVSKEPEEKKILMDLTKTTLIAQIRVFQWAKNYINKHIF